MSHKSASFQQILAPLESEPSLRRGKNACRTKRMRAKEGRARVGGRRFAGALTSVSGLVGVGGASLFGGVAVDMKPLVKAPPPYPNGNAMVRGHAEAGADGVALV